MITSCVCAAWPGLICYVLHLDAQELMGLQRPCKCCEFFASMPYGCTPLNALAHLLSCAVLQVMPSMRSMMTAGPALKKCNIAGYNCSYLPIDHPHAFDEVRGAHPDQHSLRTACLWLCLHAGPLSSGHVVLTTPCYSALLRRGSIQDHCRH